MKLTLEQVRHVAHLARLALTPEEEVRAASKLSAILDAVDTLRELDTTDVPPTSHAVLVEALLREDVVKPGLPPEVALANAPAKADTSFVVPKVIE
ncbi:MAG: Asp-tRNA(Asn)/Glu-tRNA(Gln) amidotransferase subunit GatC [Myxococcaceae bacterium]|nr:Asp-tRNA(Asn)/Glu-tRNA(Gln) amidotransferase subunit GatC [Myxococcaceae bacterium]MCI0670376.1 Asp-tRNA(Asn)/Glu-tRNA(Gln) amidotransferase subunit GatC [Myxococcaceae bacterium]